MRDKFPSSPRANAAKSDVGKSDVGNGPVSRHDDAERMLPNGTLSSKLETTRFEEESGERVAIARLGSILIVEADPDEQWQLARRLTDAGARVVGTSSGDGALALLSEWAVDAVLIAEELPGMDGFEVARRMLEDQPDIRILIMADHPSESVLSSARLSGAIGCIPRPVDLQSLAVQLADSTRIDDELLMP